MIRQLCFFSRGWAYASDAPAQAVNCPHNFRLTPGNFTHASPAENTENRATPSHPRPAGRPTAHAATFMGTADIAPRTQPGDPHRAFFYIAPADRTNSFSIGTWLLNEP